MTRLNDETLIALIDEALPPEELLVAERELVADPDALRSLLLLRLSAMSIRAAFDGTNFQAVPDRLRQTVLGQCRPHQRGTTAGRFMAALAQRPAAAALCVAVLAGLCLICATAVPAEATDAGLLAGLFALSGAATSSDSTTEVSTDEKVEL